MSKIIAIVGPSGSGKTVLGQLALQPIGGQEIVSTTTRAPRKGEVDGVNYNFVTKEEFENLIAQNAMLEYTNYAGAFYGMQRATIENMMKQYNLIYAVVDIIGAQAMKQHFGDAVTIVFVRVHPDTIYRRMAERGDDPAAIQKRLQHAKEKHEFDNGKYCDVIVDNESRLEDAIFAMQEVAK